jgi:phenylalanyl-tRNA synthetase beta chain
VCTVDIGSGTPLQVVCGASNARAGLKTVFAAPGTRIPSSGMVLKVGSIRGVESQGMLCSAEELCIRGDSDGILELPRDAPVGESFRAYGGYDDPLIEINLTPNRADCASIHGIARDLSATGIGDLRPSVLKPLRGAHPSSIGVQRVLDDAHLCPLFVLRTLHGIKNAPSPDWLRRRLENVKQRSISCVVDVTNDLTLDRGRPLHAFDLKKLRGNLTIRRAFDGETFTALDGKTYTLDPSMVVIADNVGVQALAGIIGGAVSAVDESTTDIALEAALWNPLNIAQTGRKLGIHTDARYRFERGVDPAFVFQGLDLATQHVQHLCGGTASETVIVGEVPSNDVRIDFPWSEVKRVTGMDVAKPEMRALLSFLGFHLSGVPNGDRVYISPPSWRADVTQKADIVEEIVRIKGLESLVSTPLPLPESLPIEPMLGIKERRARASRRLLASRGLVEAITWSFLDSEDAKRFGGGSAALRLANPIAANLSDMRPHLLPNLLRALQRNQSRGLHDLALFEVGPVFIDDTEDGQLLHVCGVRTEWAGAAVSGRHWQRSEAVDAYTAKEDLLSLLTLFGGRAGVVSPASGGACWSWRKKHRWCVWSLASQTLLGL